MSNALQVHLNCNGHDHATRGTPANISKFLRVTKLSKEMSHRISAGAIMERDERLLLVHHKWADNYDFWVCPGGGVKGEEFFNPECRFVKFWFAGHYVGGEIDTSHPEARAEKIVEADWFRREELTGKTVFPSLITERYWSDRAEGIDVPIHLPLKKMTMW